MTEEPETPEHSIDADTQIGSDRMVWRHELQLMVCSETVRLWIKSGKLPTPDVRQSTRTMGWRLSTLHAAGIRWA